MNFMVLNMKRDIDNDLIKWKKSQRRKPLIIRGARQVGKTWSIKEFGKQQFKNTVIIDFERNKEFSSVFDSNLDPKTIIETIEILKGEKIKEGATLLFFDEIQNTPKAIMALRYFYEEMPNLHVIAAGSLIEFALSTISFPVGRIQYLKMHPLTFSEFLIAISQDNLAEIINNKPKVLHELIHNKLLDYLKKYFFIGGMPEAVKTFIKFNSMEEVFNVHNELIYSFRDDFSKYGVHTNKEALDEVFYSIPKNIGNQIKYSKLSQNFTSPTIKKIFNLFQKAEIIKKIPSVSNLGIPLKSHISEKKFKALFLDIGLWQNTSGVSIANEYKNTNLMNLYQGNLAEQYIGQELYKLFDENLLYWVREKKGSSSELDYLINTNNCNYPIEVKSGKSGSLKSLHIFLNTYKDNNLNPIVFSTRNYSELKEKDGIFYFIPLYYVSGFKNWADNLHC